MPAASTAKPAPTMLGASTLATAPAAAPVRHVVNIAEIVGKLGNVTGTTVFSDVDPDVQSFLEHLEYGRCRELVEGAFAAKSVLMASATLLYDSCVGAALVNWPRSKRRTAMRWPAACRSAATPSTRRFGVWSGYATCGRRRSQRLCGSPSRPL